MRQLLLTDEQHALLGDLERIFRKCKESDISFVYDVADGSLTAFNTANVSECYSGTEKEDDTDDKIDWDSSSIVEEATIDYFVSAYQDYYLKFE